jgi:alpha-beta hydrolase superfamily lysophospholipase
MEGGVVGRWSASRAGRFGAWALAAAGVLAALAAPGCMGFRSRELNADLPSDEAEMGPPAAGCAVRPEDWPARRTEGLQEAAAGTPKAIYSLEADEVPPLGEWPDWVVSGTSRPVAWVRYAGVHGVGILRVFEYPAGRRDWRTRSLGTIRFVSYGPHQDRLVDERLTKFADYESRQRARLLAGLSGVKGVRPADSALTRMVYEGTAIRLTPPAPGAGARGTIVHMAGLGSLEYEQPVLDELSRRGWWVVRIATPRVWWFKGTPWTIDSEDAVPRVAWALARTIDDLVAEPAYAAEAVLDYLQKQRPDVPLRPLVMVGCSAGALAAPAVVARKAELFDAAVLIGGGANLLEISQESDLTDAGIRLEWPGGAVRESWRRELFREYLVYSRLDPYRTALCLRDKPVLVVHANLDTTVPAENGWLLWERLGRPDRYVFTGGHRLLFWRLGDQAGRIADWLDEHTSSQGASWHRMSGSADSR